MNLYAIKVRKTDLALIALLNNGVEPAVEEKETYFIFDAEPNSEFVPQIITEREFTNTYQSYHYSPHIYNLKS